MLKHAMLMVLALGCSPLMAEVRDVDKHFFDPKFGDLKSDLASAREQGKKGVLIMFELEDCPFCHRMKMAVLNQSEVQDYTRRHFVVLSVDANGATALTDFRGRETTEKAFATEHRIRATPVFAFFDLEGNAVMRFTGATRDAQEFLQLARYVVEEAYKIPGMSFTKYKQQAAK